MSYNGTVYCSYCGNKGHNKRSCESRKTFIEANPDSYQARMVKESGPRKCSYCRCSDHTRRTCAVLKADRTILVTKLATQRAKALEKMVECGVGIGALLETKYSYYDSSKAIAMVVNIPWLNENTSDAIKLRFQFMKDGLQRGATFSLGDDDELDDFGYDPLVVVSPLSARDVHAGAPSAWLNGSLYDEEIYFPKGEARRGWMIDG